MKLIFIRHGEPDYNTDSLTRNGILESEALAKRIKNWDVTDFFVSPLGRAIETAAPTLKLLNREATTLPFLHEYSYQITDPVTKKAGIPWDFVPSSWTNEPYMFETGNAFLNFPCIKENPKISEKYDEAINGIDSLLSSYGYIREGKIYRNINGIERFLTSTVSEDKTIRNNSPLKEGEKETTLVFFCHLGIICLLLSHLINIPFEAMVHGFFMPTSSITVLSTEERWSNECYFRVQALGDCNHLIKENIKISPAGSFADPFQG